LIGDANRQDRMTAIVGPLGNFTQGLNGELRNLVGVVFDLARVGEVLR
jgi:hypothetical protein